MNFLKTISFSVLLLLLAFSCKKEDEIAPEPKIEIELISDLRLDVSVNLDSVIADEEITFTISLFNSGPSKATGVVVMNDLPNGYDLIDYNISNSSSFDTLSGVWEIDCLLYTSPSPRDLSTSRMPSSA